MPAPTKNALQKHPMAIVTLGFRSNNTTTVEDREFEWFDTEEGLKEYFAEDAKWCKEDVKTNGDVHYVTVEITDTSTFTLGRVVAYGGTPEDHKARVALIKATPTLVIQPAQVRAKKTVEPPSEPKGRKVRAQVQKGRAKGAAAAVLDKEESAAPEPRAKKVLKRNAAAPKPSGPALKGEARAEALQKRLAAKKAPSLAAPEAAEVVADSA